MNAAEISVKSKSLPEPLTFDLALSLLDQQHPNLRYVDADVQSSHFKLQQLLSKNDLSINLKASARWVDPSEVSPNQKSEDHKAELIVNKTLYDFGRSSSLLDSASQQLASQKLNYLNTRQKQYLEVMKRYFNVVLADLQFYRYNEEMAVAFIRFDRMQIRTKLGQHTELEVAEKKLEYERVRHLRTYSQNQQRISRSLLAQSLNKPNSLPTTVTRPEFDLNSRKLPVFEELLKNIRENNPTLKSLRAKLISARKNIEFAKASDNPMLTGGLEAYSYTRETSSSDKWRAQITLDIPLWSGGQVDAAVAKAKSQVYKIEAQIAQQEFAIQQKALELTLGIQNLKLKYDEVISGMNFSELSLDKNRALYELEVRSDLGYSMVKFSEAERKVVQTGFEIIMAWAQLDALSGTLLNKMKKQ